MTCLNHRWVRPYQERRCDCGDLFAEGRICFGCGRVEVRVTGEDWKEAWL